MKVHLYSLCWNDADMLGFMFRHYDRFVDRYVFFDDGSTDDSVEIIDAHPKAEVRHVSLNTHPESFVLSGMQVLEECWKESRGEADWVICTDIDEHLCHPHFLGYLKSCQDAGVTLIPALGYQMLSETVPPPDATLCETVTTGAPWVQMNKLSVFAPDAIEDTHFGIGRHTAEPVGNIVLPQRDELLLLHYKYLGFERTQERHERGAARLREAELSNDWCHRWRWSREQLRADWQRFARRAVDVSRDDLKPWESHPEPRWWNVYRARALVPAAE